MQTKTRFSLFGLLGFFILAGVAAPALAQWAWKDGEGRAVFSDRPPPPSVADKDILKRPQGKRVDKALTQGAMPADAAQTAAKPSAPVALAKPIVTVDPEIEKRKEQAKAKEKEQQQAQAEQVAAAKKDNCERAKRAKASYDSGMRIAAVNSKGEREILSDQERAAEQARVQDVIKSDCS